MVRQKLNLALYLWSHYVRANMAIKQRSFNNKQLGKPCILEAHFVKKQRLLIFPFSSFSSVKVSFLISLHLRTFVPLNKQEK